MSVTLRFLGDDDADFVFDMLRDPVAVQMEVTFWFDRGHWGRGIGSQALALLLEQVPDRPLLAGTLVDNLGSLAVLRRNGFREVARERIHALGRGMEVDAIRLRLD